LKIWWLHNSEITHINCHLVSALEEADSGLQQYRENPAPNISAVLPTSKNISMCLYYIKESKRITIMGLAYPR